MTLKERAFRKVTRRLIPFLFLIYVVAYLDRVNVSFAQLQLEDDLGFSDTIFGLGAGIFSLGYVIFGVPSNLALARFGARRWLAAIMVVWGVISASIRSSRARRASTCSASSWAPPRRASSPASSCTSPGGSPSASAPARSRCSSRPCPRRTWPAGRCRAASSSWTVRRARRLAVAVHRGGGARRSVLGYVTLRYLDERPADAEWLEPDEREFLTAEVASEVPAVPGRTPGRAHERPRVGARARVLRPARGRVRPHLLRPRPRPGPDRLQRLRGRRAVSHPVWLRDGRHGRGRPVAAPA